MTKIKFDIVVAFDKNLNIGRKGYLPWNKITEDMRYFRILTTYGDKGLDGYYISQDRYPISKTQPRFSLPERMITKQNNAVLMGRKTYESIPYDQRPLPNRINIVLTKGGLPDVGNKGTLLVNTVEHVMELNDIFNWDRVYVVGGAEIYNHILENYQEYVDIIYITKLDATFDNCDTRFPFLPRSHIAQGVTIGETGMTYTFHKYKLHSTEKDRT
jgi:dihydrofolate reductase